MKFTTLILGAAALAFGTMALADGHETVDPAVKARQAHMQLYAHNLGILGGMAQAKTDYDAGLAQIAADNLAAMAALNETTYWPAGTSEGTKALPAIWDNMDDFIAKQDGLKEAADTMVTLAGVDLATLQSGMAALGSACTACHREYRARDE